MLHRIKKIRLSADKAQTTAIIRNLAMSVIIYEKIKTTEAKAKAVRPFIDHLIGLAKTKEKREAIRLIESLLQHDNSSKKIFEVLLERYKERNTGFTRITKLGYRNGDNAPVVQLELLQ